MRRFGSFGSLCRRGHPTGFKSLSLPLSSHCLRLRSMQVVRTGAVDPCMPAHPLAPGPLVDSCRPPRRQSPGTLFPGSSPENAQFAGFRARRS